LLAGLNDAQYNWHPAPGKWSMTQRVAHIVITDTVCLPVLEKCLADAISPPKTTAFTSKPACLGITPISGNPPFVDCTS